MRYLAGRFVLAVSHVLALSALVFLLFELAPGDYWSGGDDPRISAESRRVWRNAAGASAGYWAWLTSAAQGDFGASWHHRVPVTRLLADRLPATMCLAASAWLIAWALGLLAAFTVERRRGAPVAVACGLLPEALTGSLLLWGAVAVGISPSGLPLALVIMVVALVPAIYLHGAASLAEARRARFAQLAVLRGTSRADLWFRYLLPAAAHPLLGLTGATAASAFGAALITEWLTGRAGLGPLFLDAFANRDYPVVQAVLLLLGVVVAVANLLSDLALYRLDPRIRVAA